MKKLLKNISRIMFSLLLVVSIFGVGNVLADEVIFKITNIEVKEKSNGVRVNDVSISGGSLKNDIEFSEINDYIKYNITIKNSTSEDYIIKSMTDDNASLYLGYTYDDLSNVIVKAGEEKIFELQIKYIQATNNLTVSDQTVSLIITYEKNGILGTETITNDANNGITNNTKTQSLTNPKTNDGITKYIILGIVSLVGLSLTTVSKKHLSRNLMVMGIFSVIAIPLGVKADTNKFLINFNNNILIKESITDEEQPIIMLASMPNFDTFINVFNQEGACTFNGSNGITGSECSKYLGQTYIDTGIKLYDEDNYSNDYEVGFDIVNYDYEAQEYLSTIFNCKYENKSRGYPGVVFRKHPDTKSNFEVSQSTNHIKDSTSFSSKDVTSVKIVRKNKKYYYSFNNGPYTFFHEDTTPEDMIDNTAWFGAAQDIKGKPMRYFYGTLSNMYVKVGKYNSDNYEITFNPNGGKVDETNRYIEELEIIGELPTPTKENSKFLGWYTDPVGGAKITNEYLVFTDKTLYAHWSDYVVKANDKYYETLQSAIDDASNTKTTLTILKDFSEKIVINNDQNIVLNVLNYTISNDSNKGPVISNNGILEINSGTFKSEANEAVINNNAGATLKVNNTNIIATGIKQALYNNVGDALITGS